MIEKAMLSNDNDIVRGLGFVTLYGAYLEEQIENLLRMLHPVQPFTEQLQRGMISAKIKTAKAIVERMEFEARDELLECLNVVRDAFEWRNELVHGRIYGGFDREDTLKSGRPNVPDRPVDAAELYELANRLDDLRSGIYRPMIIKIPRFLANQKKPEQ